MKSISTFNFLSIAEKITLRAYADIGDISPLGGEIVGRIAATFLSPAATLDFIIHSSMLLPSFTYTIGTSIYHQQSDFTLPWQHLQRVRNAVTPILLGSIFGLIHPEAGLAMSEPTDKHIVIGILSSNIPSHFRTACSPIHSFKLIEKLAKNNRVTAEDNEIIEVFSKEAIQLIKTASSFEWSLERLLIQNYLYKFINTNFFFRTVVNQQINQSNLPHPLKEALKRISVIFASPLAAVDFTIALLAQAFFLTTGALRLFTDRGPIYTEITTDPLMHLSFFIQSVLKFSGVIVGSAVGLISPEIGFKVSLLPGLAFFKMQMAVLKLQIKLKMQAAEPDSCLMVPIVYSLGKDSFDFSPLQTMHMTYLIIEKSKNMNFNLYWVDRPTVHTRTNCTLSDARDAIHSLLSNRFPFMDMQNQVVYPFENISPKLNNSTSQDVLLPQGNNTNCVVSNLFGALEVFEKLHQQKTNGSLNNASSEKILTLRYRITRAALMHNYGFYRSDFYPFVEDQGFSLDTISKKIIDHSSSPI